jgi:hypothetical protein
MVDEKFDSEVKMDPENKPEIKEADTKVIVNLECGDFLEQLVTKCEVQSYPDLYHKLLEKKGDIIRCNDLFDQDPKKSIDKLKETTESIPDVLLIYLFDPRIINTKSDDPNIPFQKIPYIINEKGLIRVIFNYRKEHFIGQEISLSGLCHLWEIPDSQQEKLIQMINNIIQKRQIYATWKEISNEETKEQIKKLIFMKMTEVPEKRKQIVHLIFALVIMISSLIIFALYFERIHF